MRSAMPERFVMWRHGYPQIVLRLVIKDPRLWRRALWLMFVVPFAKVKKNGRAA